MVEVSPMLCIVTNVTNHPIEFLTKSSQYKNANIANFILAVPLEMKKNGICDLEMQFSFSTDM